MMKADVVIFSRLEIVTLYLVVAVCLLYQFNRTEYLSRGIGSTINNYTDDVR